MSSRSENTAPNTDTVTSTVQEQVRHLLSSLSEMNLVEEIIRSKLNSESPLLEEIPSYLLSLGGKRIRPALTLLCAQAFGMKPFTQPVLDVAAGIELIHMATLLHDDIIDKSPVRRHRESAFLKYGVPNTLLAGDFLLVRAFSLCARLDRFIVDQTERACIELTEGEIDEISVPLSEHTVDSSLEIARKKTAALFRLGACTGTYLALPEQTPDATAVKNMTLFGEYLGIGFQILDDILDITSDQDLLGKRSGMDLVERKPSIVNVLWLASGDPVAEEVLLGTQEKAPETVEDPLIQSAITKLRTSKVVGEAKDIARQYVKKANRALEECIDIPDAHADPKAISALTALTEFTLERMG